MSHTDYKADKPKPYASTLQPRYNTHSGAKQNERYNVITELAL